MAYVLIVDDDEDFATAVAVLLRSRGHEVSIKNDTILAMASMENRRPDLVILDVMFPQDASAGFALARAMGRHNEKTKGIPILMLTAVNKKFPLGFSVNDTDDNWLPVSDFLEKPVDLKLLASRAESLLKGRPA